MVVWKSPNGRDQWEPVKPADVPDWVKAEDVMGRLVNGDMCVDPTLGDSGSDFYRVEKISDVSVQ